MIFDRFVEKKKQSSYKDNLVIVLFLKKTGVDYVPSITAVEVEKKIKDWLYRVYK